MTVDDIVLRALEGGPVTVDDIIRRLEKPVRTKLEKLRVRGVVLREGRGGPHRTFIYKLLRPDHVAEALTEKGGLARATKAVPETRPPAQSELLSASNAEPARQRKRTFLKRSSDHFRTRHKQKEG
jgi:hypothetical protein